ncbi:MAG: hypothetical protein WCT08_03625 [Patescibacteria group bacterium]|jgi:hypothetical protein
MTEDKPQSMKDKVLGEIRSQHISMKPKWQFFLKSLLIILLLSIIALYILFHTSFLFYSLHYNGSLFLTHFGVSGLRRLILSLPWLWLLSGIILTILLGILVEKQTKAYRFPLFYTVMSSILLIAIISALCVILPIQTSLHKLNTETRIPIIGPMFKNLPENEPLKTYIGEVSELNGNGFLLTNRQNQTTRVILTPETKLNNNLKLQNGLEIMMIGEQKANYIEAEGIRALLGGFGADVHAEIND